MGRYTQHERRMRQARLAQGEKNGKFSIDATPAAFLPYAVHVHDFAYLENELGDLIEQAQARLMWGARLWPGDRPFYEELTRLDCETRQAKPLKPTESDLMVQRRWHEHLDRVAAQEEERRARPIQVTASTISGRLNMRNRTREERIADLRKALANQEEETQ